ncbi:MAG: questin oxidase family protein, partial [Clostridium sp.]
MYKENTNINNNLENNNISNSTFNEFFYKYINYSSDYGGKFSNHMPMVAYSLFQMGEPLDKIGEYLDGFIEKNQCIEEELNVQYNITQSNFREYLGVEDSLGSYYKFFKDKSRDATVENLIKQYLEILIEGCAGRAFHPLIRLGYSVKSGSDEEIIRSLSYFASTYLTHGINNELVVSKNILKNINDLSEILGNEKFEGNLIADKIERVYGMGDFRENIFSLGNNENEIMDMLDKIINKL